MDAEWTEMPAVVEGRWALAQALRQWKTYADEWSSSEHMHYLGYGNELEDKFYARAKAALEGMEAAADESEKARHERGTSSVQRVDVPAARWEENARALLKMALELALELRGKCSDPIHIEQLKELNALDKEWAGSGHIGKLCDAGGKL